MAGDIYEFLQGKNARLVKAIDKCPDLGRFIMSTTQQILNFANKKGCKLEDVEIENPVFTRDDHFYAQVKVRR